MLGRTEWTTGFLVGLAVLVMVMGLLLWGAWRLSAVGTD
jgi:hypothetical protein